MFNIFKRKKTKITLQEFAKAIAQVAAETGENYYEVRIGYAPHWYQPDIGHGIGVYLSAYINGKKWVYGKTIQECVEELRGNVDGLPLSPIKEVTF